MSIMIKLQEIKKNKTDITCIAFVEDCVEKINISFDVVSKEIKSVNLPLGYEWCKKHINYAQEFLVSLIDENDVPEHKTIMWY